MRTHVCSMFWKDGIGIHEASQSIGFMISRCVRSFLLSFAMLRRLATPITDLS